MVPSSTFAPALTTDLTFPSFASVAPSLMYVTEHFKPNASNLAIASPSLRPTKLGISTLSTTGGLGVVELFDGFSCSILSNSSS